MARKRPPRPFKLRDEVCVAFLAPALTAGISGLATHQTALAVAAVTSIGLTSALVATITGVILMRRGAGIQPRRRLLRSLTAGLVAGVIGAAAGLAASGWLSRLSIDLPLSAVLAATIITWRWHGSAANREDFA
ncbi:hypothetical protein [Catenulispora subtropica]|uniref:Uncharacterized protein n=1 Tax=Catenulispora subtropica TaxID=450798 RepID=A0ABP5DMG0_9ACTN